MSSQGSSPRPGSSAPRQCGTSPASVPAERTTHTVAGCPRSSPDRPDRSSRARAWRMWRTPTSRTPSAGSGCRNDPPVGAGAALNAGGSSKIGPLLSEVMERHVRLRELLLGVEGLALLRHLYDGTDDDADRRLDEVRHLLDDEAFSGTEPTSEADPRTGYRSWSERYDEPGNPIIAIEEIGRAS